MSSRTLYSPISRVFRNFVLMLVVVLSAHGLVLRSLSGVVHGSSVQQRPQANSCKAENEVGRTSRNVLCKSNFTALLFSFGLLDQTRNISHTCTRAVSVVALLARHVVKQRPNLGFLV